MANAVNTHAFFEGFTQFPAVIAKGLALRDGEVFREISTPRMSGFSAQKQHDAAREETTMCKRLHVHLVELRAGRNPGVDGDLFDAVENFMSAQAGQMKLEEPRMDQAQILALELAGVEIIDPPEPEDWYRDEDEDMDMDMDDFYPSIPQP